MIETRRTYFLVLLLVLISSLNAFPANAAIVTTKYIGAISSVVRSGRSYSSEANFYIQDSFAVGDSFSWSVTFDDAGTEMTEYNSFYSYIYDHWRTYSLADFEPYGYHFLLDAVFSFSAPVEKAFNFVYQSFGSNKILSQANQFNNSFYQKKEKRSYSSGYSQDISFLALQRPDSFTASLKVSALQVGYWASVGRSTEITITNITPDQSLEQHGLLLCPLYCLSVLEGRY